jgi:hypothetical protein
MKYQEVIVYQMGKVGSTSIVSSLNRIPGVNAYQSHFLGYETLIKKVEQLISPGVNEHFLRHGVGQLCENINLTRKVNSYQSGQETGKLLFISLAREPLDWFRSQVVQEIDGYLEGFGRIVNKPSEQLQEEDIIISLDKIGNFISEAVKESPYKFGTRPFSDWFWRDYLPDLPRANAQQVYIAHTSAFFRPFYWFDQHIKPLLKVDLSMERLDKSYIYITKDWFDLLVFRYEDMEELEVIMRNEIAYFDFSLDRLNESKEKKYADVISQAISDWRGKPLISGVEQSAYCRVFQYGYE